jgi:hypothetical protein
MDLNTVFGAFKADRDGFQIARKMVTFQWQDGKKVVVWPEELAPGTPRFPTPPGANNHEQRRKGLRRRRPRGARVGGRAGHAGPAANPHRCVQSAAMTGQATPRGRD